MHFAKLLIFYCHIEDRPQNTDYQPNSSSNTPLKCQAKAHSNQFNNSTGGDPTYTIQCSNN